MPFVNVDDYKIYYEVKGDGIPLLLLEGLGYATWMWKFQVPEFSKRFTMIMPDNRGVGQSTPLRGVYSVEKFAGDSLSVVNFLGFEKFYVMGVSMGGFIAQELAAAAPDRIRGLILVSTSAGGKSSIPMPKEVFEQMQLTLPGESTRDKLIRTMRLAFTDHYPVANEEEFASLIEHRMKSLQPPDQLMFQSLSSINFDRSSSNGNLNVPSLIVAGTADKVLPWLNSLILYKTLPRSSLILFKEQNHLLFIERFSEFNRAVIDFVEMIEENRYSEFVKEVE
ncbi:MAG: alpha/beta fold hydrolase [Thermoplasmata archaeon]